MYVESRFTGEAKPLDLAYSQPVKRCVSCQATKYFAKSVIECADSGEATAVDTFTSNKLPLVGCVASAMVEVSAREDPPVVPWKHIEMSDAQAEVVIITARALHSKGRLFASRAYDPTTAEGPYPAVEHDECASLRPCGLLSEGDPYLEPAHQDPVCSACSPRSPSPDAPAEDTTSEPTKREAHDEEARGFASCLRQCATKDSGGNRCKQQWQVIFSRVGAGERTRDEHKKCVSKTFITSFHSASSISHAFHQCAKSHSERRQRRQRKWTKEKKERQKDSREGNKRQGR